MSVLLRKQYSTIKKEKLSEQAKSVLKSMYETTNGFKDAKSTRKIKPKFEAFYNKLKESKPEAIVGGKAKSKSAPKKSADDFKAARARRKPQTGVPKDKKAVDKDATRPAISKRGKRTSKAGNTYYEYRDNRFDKNPSKYPMLEKGGYMADGGEIRFVDEFSKQDGIEVQKNIYENSDLQDYTATITMYPLFRITRGDTKDEVVKRAKEIQSQMAAYLAQNEDKSDRYKTRDFDKGGFMADGGEIELGDKVKAKYAKYHATVTEIVDDVEVPYAKITYSDGIVKKADLKNLQKVELRVADEYVNPNYMAKGGELNLGIRKMAQEEGFTPKELGKEYELTMAQAVVEALTDANYHDAARKLVSLLENNPKIAIKPNYPNPSDPKFNEKFEAINKEYDSKYWDADEKTRNFAIKVSQKSGWDGYAIAGAFEYLVRIDGGYHKLANDIKKAVVGDSNEMAKGGMMEHGLRIGDKVTTDMFWDNQIVVENQKTNKRAQIDLETGKRKDEMADGGMMAHGGETHRLDSIFEDGGEIAEGNLEMAMSNVKAIGHHAMELKSLLNDDTSIEAWVVAKLERAETDLSDVTHYIDGLSSEEVESDTYFAEGGEMPFVWKRKYGFSLGQKVICNGEVDEVVGFVTSDDEENYNMGYRLILKENGTQSLGSIEKYEKGGMMAKGGGIYSSENLYIVKVFDGKSGELLDMSRRVFAKNLSEAQRMAIEDFEYDMKAKYGDYLRFKVEEAPSMMAEGGRLSRKQKQLDLNKNGKLDSQDFKMLRAGRKNARKK